MSRLTDKDWKNPESLMWIKLGLIPMRNEGYRASLSDALRKLAHYEDLEEQGRLIELPCEKVYRIINYDSPNYAFIGSIPIETMPIYELKHIDNGNIFFSTKEKAEAKLAEVKGK